MWPCVGVTLSSLDVAGRLLPIVHTGGSSPVGPMNPAGPDGPVVTGAPIGPCGAHEALEPLEHSVLDHAGPAGRHIAIGHVGPSDCHPAGPAGPHDVGGPVGPDGSMSPSIHKVLKPSEHSVLDHAGPPGRHVAVAPVGQLRTLS